MRYAPKAVRMEGLVQKMYNRPMLDREPETMMKSKKEDVEVQLLCAVLMISFVPFIVIFEKVDDAKFSKVKFAHVRLCDISSISTTLKHHRTLVIN